MPNKSLGQHWLKDREALDAIADMANITEQDTVLEIGPGLGTLTAKLLSRTPNVVAVEFDSQLYGNLLKSFVNSSLTLINADILKYDPGQLPSGYKVVANIPYYITGPILQKFVKAKNQPSIMVLLMQKEVAERIAAGPGQLSVLAISVQYWYEVRLGAEVPAKLFEPRPKVDSQVIVLTKRKAPLVSIDYETLIKLVKRAFANKRKTLVNSLGSSPEIDPEIVRGFLQRETLSPTVRAQELTFVQWAGLSELLAAKSI
jgi:16S rRNA (adenine1518-N6/adenine1519-N6)-dimethyltransferase